MEFSNLQPVSQSGNLHEQISIKSAADMSLIFNSRANAGDQVELFLAIAEGQPETALTTFSTVVRNLSSPPINALALQGFGKIAQPYRQALASCASKESQELLKLLCDVIKSRSSDLTAWAAAEAIKEMGFSLDNIQHPQGGNLPEPPRRLQNEILDRKIQNINKIQRLNSRGEFTAEYERVLEFWIYGPTSKLFNEELTSSNYIDIVRDILHFTQIRGVYLGLNANNKKVQEESFNKAKAIFLQYFNSEENEFKKLLSNSLIRFLKEDASGIYDLQKLVKALTFKHHLGIDSEGTEPTRLTIAKMNNCISSLEQYCSKVSLTFSSAIGVSGEPTLTRFLINDKDTYLEEAIIWIKRFQDQINLIETEQKKIQSNVVLLGKSFEEVNQVDLDFFYDELEPLHKEYLNLCQPPKTYEECQLFKSKLSSIKNKLLSYIINRNSDLSKGIDSLNRSFNFNSNKENAWVLIRWGMTILIGTFFISSMFVSFSPMNNSSNYSRNEQKTAWYANPSDYPKNQCGQSSSNNGCWYSVFLPYTDSNWNQIIHKCKDVSGSQTQATAQKRKQIQIASFNNEADAKGFAEFMDSYYDGTPWVGQKKCY
jgi:hypothetical protein